MIAQHSPGGLLGRRLHGVAFAQYLTIDATNFSSLKEVARSPKHYRHRIKHPRDTGPMTLGRAAHVGTLEPARFEGEFAVWAELSDKGNQRPRRGKDYDDFVAANAGKQILLPDEWDEALAISEAVRSDPRAMRYLSEGAPEVSLVWNDEETKRPCKGRIDWETEVDGEPVVVGLKTARDIRMREFGNACARLGYHLQWAIYRDAYELITGRAPMMKEIVVESSPPYDIAVFTIPTEVLELGREQYKKLLEKLSKCETAAEWPGSMPGEQVLQLPSYMFEGESDLGGLGLEFDE